MSRRDLAQILRLEDLGRSGLAKPSVIRKLGVGETLDKKRTELLTGVEDAIAYEIPYFGPDGKRLKYSRWKLIPLRDDLGIKYWQDEKTIPRLYLPPLADWRKITTDRDTRLIITEGEKKAACATLCGLPCISVGGVWSWKAKKWSMETIPDFDWFDWREREVEVCYDGDMYSNESVGKALVALTSVLVKRGARVFVKYLPTQDGLSKLDDFLVARSAREYGELETTEADTSRELCRFNEDLMYVKQLKSYFSVSERVFYGTVKSLEQRYGSVTLPSESGKRVAAIVEWARWPHMRMVDSVTYEPGKPRFVNGSYNDWRGWGVRPERGEVGRFLEVIRSVENSDWLLQWLAYPLQNPGVKLLTSVVVWSHEQGTGKSFIGNVMRDIYGENSTIITSAELHDDSYVWLRNKQFVLGEEVAQARSRAETGVLKHVITGEQIRVNEKYVPTFVLPNRANLYFTSNQPDAIHIEKGDRRFFVGKLDDTRTPEFWSELDRWRHRERGPARFMHYLLNSVDCSSFNPRAPAPTTEEKEEMTYTTMTSLEQWVDDLMRDPESALTDGLDATAKLLVGRDVFTVEGLMAALPDELMRTANRVAIGRSLARLGAVKRMCRMSDDKTRRLYAVRNIDQWRRASPAMWVANYEGRLPMIGKSDEPSRKNSRRASVTRLSARRKKISKKRRKKTSKRTPPERTDK